LKRKHEYSYEELIKLYVNRCQEKGRALDSQDIINDENLPCFATYYRHKITLNELYEAAGYKKLARKHYTKQMLVDNYIAECEKRGELLGVQDIRDNDNLASYHAYYDRGLKIEILKERAGEKEVLEGSNEYYRNNPDEFCEDCPEKDSCKYNYNLDECEYYREVKTG
jgi:hypothetical protein